MSQVLVVHDTVPFSTLEGLLRSDYLVATKSKVMHSHDFECKTRFFTPLPMSIHSGNSSEESLFRHSSPESLMGRIWREKIERNQDFLLTSSSEEAVSLAWDEKVAVFHGLDVIAQKVSIEKRFGSNFWGESWPNNYVLLWHFRCDYVRVWNEERPSHLSMIAPKGSPLVGPLRRATLRVIKRSFPITLDGSGGLR
jgi:hypothetical protein